MKIKVSLFVRSILFAGVLLLNNKDNNDNINNKTKLKLQKLKERLINKKLNSLSVVMNEDSLLKRKKTILYYTGYDCDLCVKKAFNIIEKIPQGEKIAISHNSNIGKYQFMNDYHEFIFEDKHQLIRAELKYILTPILLKLDSQNRILNCLIVQTTTTSDEINMFLNNK